MDFHKAHNLESDLVRFQNLLSQMKNEKSLFREIGNLKEKWSK